MAESAFQVPETENKSTFEERIGQSPAARRFGYAVAILANFAMLWVLRRVGVWGAPFVTEDWARVLPVLEMSVYGTIIAYLLYLFYDPRWFRRLGQIGQNVLSFRAVWAIFQVFPFAVGTSPVEAWIRIGLMAAMLAIALSTLVEAVSLVFGRK